MSRRKVTEAVKPTVRWFTHQSPAEPPRVQVTFNAGQIALWAMAEADRMAAFAGRPLRVDVTTSRTVIVSAPLANPEGKDQP